MPKTIREFQTDGTSVDDAVALLTSALGKVDELLLLEQIKTVLVDDAGGARAVALIEVLAVIGAGFIEALAEALGSDAGECLQRFALADRHTRGPR